MWDGIVVLLFLTVQCLTGWALGQCTIEGAIDIVWLIDGSRGSQGEPGETEPLSHLRQAMQEMAAKTIMGSMDVRQSFVVFSGAVDPSVTSDWADFKAIGSVLKLTDSAATSQELFFRAVDANVTSIGGSRDIPAAVSYVRRQIFTPDRATPSRKFLILVLSGPATDSFGVALDAGSTERALDSMYEEDEGVQTLLLQLGEADQFPENLLRNHVDFTFTTTFDLLMNDLIDSGVFCFFFDTAAPVQSPPPTRQPTPTIDRKCFELISGGSNTVGSLCATPAPGRVTLQYETDPEWRIDGSNIWFGGDPTTIPVGVGGSPILGAFPTTALSFVVELASVRFNDECQLYVIPTARIVPFAGNDSQAAEDGPIVAYSGDVRFHPDSDAMIFRLPVRNCQGQETTSPTVPSPAPTTRRFNLDIFYANSFPEQFKPVVNRALSRVRNLFVDDFASEVCFEQGSTWCGFTFGMRMCVDDILILFMDKALDGKDGRFAASGPCVISTDTEQVRIGQLVLDTEDLDFILQDDRLETLLVHQLIHILGFGSRWAAWGLISSGGSGHTYIGKMGLEGFLDIGGSSGTPIELDADGMHWDEQMFGTELMTPTLNLQETNPLSSLTLKSLLDMGLPVRHSGGDSFQLPGRTRRILEQPRRRSLQTIGASDVLNLPLQYTNYTVKSGRDDDLRREIEFARANIRTARAADPGSAVPASTIGIIVGVICALLLCCCLGAYFVVGRTRKRSKGKPKQPASEPKKAEGPALHANWYERTDNEGRIYWINEDTGEFSWAPPESFNRAPEREPSNSTSQTASIRRAMPRGPGGDKWSEMTDDTGNTYWVNEESGEFSWVAPAGYSNSTRSLAIQPPLSPVRRTPSSGLASASPSLRTNGLDNSDQSQLVARQPDSPQATDLDEEASPALFRRDSPVKASAEEVEAEAYDDAEEAVEQENFDDLEASAFDASNMSVSVYAPDESQYEDGPSYGGDDSHLYESMPTYSARSRMADDNLL